MGNPDDLIRLLAHSENLESLPRSGWLFGGVQNPESVASHSFNVAIVAMWIAEELGADVGRVAQMALVHDLAEAILTDIPGPAKRRIEGIAAVESQMADEILKTTHFGDLYREYVLGESIEAKITKAADTVQMVAKACQYHRQHRGDVSRFLQPRTTGVELADACIRRLLERSAKNDWSDLEYGS
ncbi:MAG: HD family hydrolase [bacterium]